MRLFWIAVAACALLCLAGCAFFGGIHGARGFSLGLVATAYDIVALWFLIKLWGNWQAGQGRPSIGAFGVVVAFFGKLPLFMYLSNVVQGLGDTASDCFLIGLALVYFALLGWGLLKK